MTDELDKLARAMERATPPPSGKAETIARAMESFDAHQESASVARPKSDRRPFGWLGQGAKTMIDAMTTRGGIAATTALVAVGFVAVLPGDVFRLPSTQDRMIIADPAPVQIEPQIMMEEPAFDLQIDGALQNGSIAERMNELADLSADAEAREMRAEPLSVPETSGLVASPQAAMKSEALRQRSVLVDDSFIPAQPDTEAFANEPPSSLMVTTENPVATFSADVDTASYGVVRSSLNRGQMPPTGAVRIEELVNYFSYAYPGPEGAHPFQPTVTVAPTPWNPGTQLVHIAVQGEMPAVGDRPPLNLVFLIDTSGSMQDPAKLPLLKQSFAMMMGELRAEDQVAIVTYAGSAGQVLAPTPASDRDTILDALDGLDAGGSTAGQAGLQQAYSVAEDMTEDGEVTRVILATDGDFNVGLSNPEALKDYIADKRETGTYLSVLGFGRGNLDDATMQALAQNGNGTAAYIDTLSEARKVLVDQLTGALFPIADDLKFQVEFNPAQIVEYRLIGYETRALNREDFNNDRVDAGDIGAGHSVTAIFEVTPVGSDAVLTDALRYQPEAVAATSGELGFLKLRYKRPGEDTSTLIETPILGSETPLQGEAAFAAAIAGFGGLLRGVDYMGEWSYADAIALANAARGEDPFGYRTEAITLMRLADTLDR